MVKKIGILTFLLLVFWVVLTLSFSVINLVLGLICALAVAWFIYYLLGDELNILEMSGGQARRLALYIPYLLKEVIKANLDVAERVLDPHLPINPVIVGFKFPLKDPLPQISLANSITLTPGTLTVDVEEDGTFQVHCLAEEHAESILEEPLQKHIIYIFKEPE